MAATTYRAELHFEVSKPFDFQSTVCGHGWYQLAPNRWLADQHMLERVERLDRGTVVSLNVSATDAGNQVRITVQTQSLVDLNPDDLGELRSKLIWMLRLEEDFSEFYQLARAHELLYERVSGGAGRLLRSSTLFEDVVKTICTTNTTWAQTKGMVSRLVNLLGEPYALAPEYRAFPTPEQIAVTGPHLLLEQVRLGYRGVYILELAQKVANGELDLEGLKQTNLPTPDLKRTLKQIKGVGDYAANTLLMILGRYEHLAIDSEVRSFTARRYFAGQPGSEAQIRALYERWGKWKYLVYWFES